MHVTTKSRVFDLAAVLVYVNRSDQTQKSQRVCNSASVGQGCESVARQKQISYRHVAFTHCGITCSLVYFLASKCPCAVGYKCTVRYSALIATLSVMQSDKHTNDYYIISQDINFSSSVGLQLTFFSVTGMKLACEDKHNRCFS